MRKREGKSPQEGEAGSRGGERESPRQNQGESGRKTQWTRDHVRKNQRGTVRGTSHREGEKIRSLRDGDQQVGTMTHAETELKVQRLRLGNPTH